MSKTNKVPLPRDGKVAAIYCRKSDAQSGETRGRSTEQQLEQCLMAAKALGYESPTWLHFIEEDGQKGDWFWRDSEGRHPGPHRPWLTRLIEAVEAGNVDAVFVWRSDRAYRDEIVAGYFLRKLREHGVRFFARSQDMAIHTASGYESATTQACSNKAYRDKISEDVTRDHAMLAAVGELTGCASMFGFRSKGLKSKEVVHVPEEIALVRLIYHWYLYGDADEGPLSATAIAERCMERGLRVRVGAKGQPVKYPHLVGVQDVLRILRNVHYSGRMKHDGKIFATKHFDVPNEVGEGRGPVVSIEDWELAQHMLESARNNRRYRRDRRSSLLSGIAVCPDCGRPLIADGKPSQRLFCAYSRGFISGVPCQRVAGRSIKTEILRDWVVEHLAPLLCAELQAIRALNRPRTVERDLMIAEAKLEEARRNEGERLAKLVSVLDGIQLGAVAAELRFSREEIERTVAELRIELRRQARDTSDEFDLLSESEGVLRQALLRAVRWIAVTKRGVVVLTSSGAYIGARLFVPKRVGKKGVSSACIAPPDPEATLECYGWIEQKSEFLLGARLQRGRWGNKGSDEELLPTMRVADGRLWLPSGTGSDELTKGGAC
jgi:DNA invertase Pin-like site-specific DNA recombinase